MLDYFDGQLQQLLANWSIKDLMELQEAQSQKVNNPTDDLLMNQIQAAIDKQNSKKELLNIAHLDENKQNTLEVPQFKDCDKMTILHITNVLNFSIDTVNQCLMAASSTLIDLTIDYPDVTTDNGSEFLEKFQITKFEFPLLKTLNIPNYTGIDLSTDDSLAICPQLTKLHAPTDVIFGNPTLFDKLKQISIECKDQTISKSPVEDLIIAKLNDEIWNEEKPNEIKWILQTVKIKLSESGIAFARFVLTINDNFGANIVKPDINNEEYPILQYVAREIWIDDAYVGDPTDEIAKIMEMTSERVSILRIHRTSDRTNDAPVIMGLTKRPADCMEGYLRKYLHINTNTGLLKTDDATVVEKLLNDGTKWRQLDLRLVEPLDNPIENKLIEAISKLKSLKQFKLETSNKSVIGAALEVSTTINTNVSNDGIAITYDRLNNRGIVKLKKITDIEIDEIPLDFENVHFDIQIADRETVFKLLNRCKNVKNLRYSGKVSYFFLWIKAHKDEVSLEVRERLQTLTIDVGDKIDEKYKDCFEGINVFSNLTTFEVAYTPSAWALEKDFADDFGNLCQYDDDCTDQCNHVDDGEWKRSRSMDVPFENRYFLVRVLKMQ